MIFFKNKIKDSLHTFSKQLNNIFKDVDKSISNLIIETN
jgi:hypothetical protein